MIVGMCIPTLLQNTGVSKNMQGGCISWGKPACSSVLYCTCSQVVHHTMGRAYEIFHEFTSLWSKSMHVPTRQRNKYDHIAVFQITPSWHAPCTAEQPPQHGVAAAVLIPWTTSWPWEPFSRKALWMAETRPQAKPDINTRWRYELKFDTLKPTDIRFNTKPISFCC